MLCLKFSFFFVFLYHHSHCSSLNIIVLYCLSQNLLNIILLIAKQIRSNLRNYLIESSRVQSHKQIRRFKTCICKLRKGTLRIAQSVQILRNKAQTGAIICFFRYVPHSFMRMNLNIPQNS